METGKPVDGRLVLRRANNPEMGVEIAGGSASSRLQLRPVRFAPAGAAADTGKDRDVETIWCSDFDTLQDRLRKLDADVAIERATAIGVTPVMIVETADTSELRRVEAPNLTRTQKG
jgi:hypothetical protein